MYNEFAKKHYKGKRPCTTKTLYNEKTLIGRLNQYFLIYFETIYYYSLVIFSEVFFVSEGHRKSETYCANLCD